MVEKKMAETAAKTEIVKQEPAEVTVVAKKKAAVKPETAKTEEPKAESVKAEAKKEAEAPKAETVKAEEPKKTPAKKTAAKKTTVKKETADTAAKTTAKAAKTTAAKAAPAKTAAKKTTTKAKKEAETTVVLQFAGKEIFAKDLMARAKADWIAAGHKESELKDITLYVKPEEFTAYYVANGVDTGSVEL